MKVGDLVMFNCEGTYAKWFYGQLGIVASLGHSKEGNLYCGVQWLQPVKYHGKFTSRSSFSVNKFEVLNDS